MKKKSLVLIVVLAASAITLWGAKKIILRHAPADVRELQSSGKNYSIREFIGIVQIKRNNVKSTVTRAGEMLMSGDTVFTGTASEVYVYNGKIGMKAGENSFIPVP
jgi:hypothetical protein